MKKNETPSNADQPVVSRSQTIEIRVRYSECDPMGVAHHTAYPVWFEMGRTELYRAGSDSYRDLEAQGAYLAVVALNVRYHHPARYDDVLTLETTLKRITRARLEHNYRLLRDGVLLATGETTLACIDAQGKLTAMPEALLSIDAND